jgi:hypothetical protein
MFAGKTGAYSGVEHLTNTLAYFEEFVNYGLKSFYNTRPPRANVIKLFTAVSYDFSQ